MKTLLDIAALEEKARAATPVVQWYSNPYYGNGQVRGPFNRWFEIVGPQEGEIQRGEVCRASHEKDVEYCAAAMNSVPLLCQTIRELVDATTNAIETFEKARTYFDAQYKLDQERAAQLFPGMGTNSRDGFFGANVWINATNYMTMLQGKLDLSRAALAALKVKL